MLRRTLNLGILAHVDAGKTTLTERLLYAAGVIDAVGSVDDGTTQTDTLALERERGITIRSAVASFAIGDITVNLIDTPGHPDFIAEVERVLSVLDGAVLVVSAVEGVQPQTRILMRALQRLRVPTLIFVNKIDRAGAATERVLEALAERLTPAIVALGSARHLGTPAAAVSPFAGDDAEFRARLVELLAERDADLLAAFVEDESSITNRRLREELAGQTKRALVHPVLFGSARTGAGVDDLTTAIAELLPTSAGDPDGALAASVFKIERGPGGEKIAYVRLFSGSIRVRDRVRFGADVEEKVTAIAAFDGGAAVQLPSVSAGDVAKLWGLGGVQIGDRVGQPGSTPTRNEFPPPTLESVVTPDGAEDRQRLRVALEQLAEQDPLIDVRQDELDELSVSLYGEVQKEVIQATLAREYSLDVTFREATPIYIERPVRAGDAIELLQAESNPHSATVGLRVDPLPAGSGVEFRLDVDARTIPLYVYKTLESFEAHMEQYVRERLRAGRFGWRVTDCAVTMTRCDYSVPDGPPSRRGPRSTAADFRKLTPLVLGQALERARTAVCEPVVHVTLELPAESIGTVVPALGRFGAALDGPFLRGKVATIETVLTAVRADELQRQLAGLTGGEGVLESTFAGYEPLSGEQPIRVRSGG